jgi:hypothetical protein
MVSLRDALSIVACGFIFESFDNGQRDVEAVQLRHHPHLRARLLRIAGQRVPEHRQLALVGDHLGGQRLHRRRLPRPVGAEQPDAAAQRHVEFAPPTPLQPAPRERTSFVLSVMARKASSFEVLGLAGRPAQLGGQAPGSVGRGVERGGFWGLFGVAVLQGVMPRTRTLASGPSRRCAGSSGGCGAGALMAATTYGQP